jgi:CMP-N-acetylneuraminic acid synthetase
MMSLAIIPARAGSKRLPGKNIRPFLGMPLIQWTIAFAQRAQCFSRIVVSTDSDEIAQCAQDAGLVVPERRPELLAGDTATSVDVALHALAQAELAADASFDLVALLQPTSPLRDLRRWTAAFCLLETGKCEAVVGVSPAGVNQAHVIAMDSEGVLSPWTSPRSPRTRPHEIGPIVAVNGSLYLISANTLRRERTFFPRGARAVICDQAWEAIDIDTEADWIAAEALARNHGITE